MIDLRTGKPVERIACYKCDKREQLLVEEKRCTETDKLVEKNFICALCAGIF